MDPNILPLPERPTRLIAFPQVVRVLDRIRFALDGQDELGEFCWFAREYPRAYRHHVEHAEFRLHTIYASMEHAHRSFVEKISHEAYRDYFEMAIGNKQVGQIYWDFESYLGALSAALDVLARICGTAFTQHTPVSFKDFCKKAPESELKNVFRMAQSRWAQRMKDYRDCFVHYTPVDTLLMLAMVRYSDGWELRAKLPSNPKAREIGRFRWTRRSELLGYAIRVWKRFVVFDRVVSRTIWRAYRNGQYPRRTSNLFSVGM
jgi:hypothetical protein